MRTVSLFLSTGLALTGGLYACQKQELCTTEFRSIGITVLGDTLTDFYTVRLATSDTIRRSTQLEAHTHVYIVLDDSYQSAIAHSQERFKFIGKINTNIVVNEDYTISADGCHISKQSGKNDVQL